MRINWELPNEKAIFDEERGEESFMVGAEYTLSLNERANLRHVLESWRGKDFSEEELKGFDLKILLGKGCLVNVVHKKSTRNPGRTYAQVTSVVPLPKGMTCPKATLDRILYDINHGEGGDYAKLPEWIQEKVQNSEEWNTQPEGDGEDDPDDWSEPPEENGPPPKKSDAPPPRKPVKRNPTPPQPEDDDDIPF